MLVSLNDILKDAQKNRYGIGMFNTFNLEMARGVITAAEELNAPVIVGTAEALIPNASLEDVASLLIPMAKRSPVPVAIHLDHGLSEDVLMHALQLGFTSIMYDCSTDCYDMNVKKVAAMAKKAKSFGAAIEAELGHVCFPDSDESLNDAYTNPQDAKNFADETGIDALAVAIGTAHGVYKTKPVLDIERLKQISEAVDTPLVLHGGSGLSNDDFRQCVTNGISKVNIFTDINIAGARAAAENYKPGKGITDINTLVIEAIKQATIKKLKVIGCENKA